jgi:hypothetical protein
MTYLHIVHNWDASEPYIRLTVYLTAALPDELNEICTGSAEGSMRLHAANMLMHRVRMELLSICHQGLLETPSPFITYPGTIPMPTSWQTLTTPCNHHLLPPCCRTERRCAGVMEWFLYRRWEQQEVLPWYSERELYRELVSCTQGRIQFKSQLISSILKHTNN